MARGPSSMPSRSGTTIGHDGTRAPRTSTRCAGSSGASPVVQSAMTVGATSADPVAAMVDPPPFQQKYRDVREGEKPGEGIALAGGSDATASNLPRGADAIEHGPSARRICSTRIEPLARAAKRVTIFVEASHPGPRAESAFRSYHINRRAPGNRELAGLILTFQTVKSTNPARCPMTSTVRPWPAQRWCVHIFSIQFAIWRG